MAPQDTQIFVRKWFVDLKDSLPFVPAVFVDLRAQLFGAPTHLFVSKI